MNDAKMLEMLHKDPNKGMNVLMDEYVGLIYAIVKHVLADFECDSSEIEDCVAEVFSEFYFDYSAYDPKKSSLKNYLCRIAKNNAIDLSRKKQKQGARVDIDNDDFPVQITDETNLEESVLKQELLHEVFSAIETLGEPDSSIIFRKYYYGESSETIAKRLNMTESAVNTRTHRALKKLRELLEGGNK
jgi:RNA polymerase sigma-70 factor (ECF subfamily)